MRMTCGRMGLFAAAAIAVSTALVAPNVARAAGISAAGTTIPAAGVITDPGTTPPVVSNSYLNYSTSGVIQLQGITGSNVISFNSVGDNSFTAPSAFSLGDFKTIALPAGQSTTYNATPFSITYVAQKVDGGIPTINETPITITGHLNGTVSGPYQNNVVATFDAPSKSSFRTGGVINTLEVLGTTGFLVPSSTNSGVSTAEGRISLVQAPGVPEPATVAIFLAGIAGYGLRRRRRAVAA